jgi:hypothetical protein
MCETTTRTAEENSRFGSIGLLFSIIKADLDGVSRERIAAQPPGAGIDGDVSSHSTQQSTTSQKPIEDQSSYPTRVL